MPWVCRCLVSRARARCCVWLGPFCFSFLFGSSLRVACRSSGWLWCLGPRCVRPFVVAWPWLRAASLRVLAFSRARRPRLALSRARGLLRLAWPLFFLALLFLRLLRLRFAAPVQSFSPSPFSHTVPVAHVGRHHGPFLGHVFSFGCSSFLLVHTFSARMSPVAVCPSALLLGCLLPPGEPSSASCISLRRVMLYSHNITDL